MTEIQLSVTLNFNFRFVAAGSDEADYSFHDLNLRCEPLETEYDDYMTYYQKMEFENELPSFEGESLVPGTGLTLIRKKLKRSFVLLRVVSYEDVPKKEQAWFGLKYCSYAVRDKGALALRRVLDRHRTAGCAVRLIKNFYVPDRRTTIR